MPRLAFAASALLAVALAASPVRAQTAIEGPALGLARAAATREARQSGEAPASALRRTAAMREAATADGRVALELVATDAVSLAALARAGADVQRRHGRYLTALAAPEDIGRIARVAGVQSVELSRRVALADDHAAAVTGVQALRSGLLGASAYTGAGSLVCVIDTGLDWTHRDFRAPSDPTKTRIVAVWDQTLVLSAGEVRPAGFSYGVAYSRAQIDDELDGTPTGVVRMRDASGHGTQVTGTAAGNGSSLSPAQHVGMAPDAGIVVVKTTYASAAVADALAYCDDMGTATGRPVVANLSLAADFGPHDGSDLYNAAATAFGASPGRVAVLAAGNGGGTPAHVGGGVPAGGSAAHTITVPAYTATPGVSNDRLDLDLWIDDATPVTVEITTPSGVIVAQAAGGEIETTTPDGTVYLYNQVDAANGDRRIFVVIYDLAAATPAPGAWTLRLVNPSGVAVGYDGWFYDRDIGSPAATATISGANTDKTLGNTASGAVIVGSWTHRWRWTGSDGSANTFGAADLSGEVSAFSGRGPTRDGRILPTVVTPGQGVIGARSSSTGPAASSLVAGGVHVVGSGTSFSTPVAAGAVALLLQQDPTLTGTAAAALLESTARADAFTGPLPNTAYGAGKLDAYTAMARLVDAGSTATLATVAFDGAPTTSASATPGGALALRFTSPLADGGRLRGVSLQTGSAGQGLALTAPLSVEIWTDDGGAPGARIGTADAVPATAVQAFSWSYVALTGAAADLSPATPYWLVVAPTGGTLVLLGEATTVSGNSFILAPAPPATHGNAASSALTGPFVATAAGSDLSIRPVLTSRDAFSVSATTSIAAAGWRLLGAPVSGVTVGTLASLNLVQGIGSADDPASAEYPSASPNLFAAYTGNTTSHATTNPFGGFVRPANRLTALAPGKGFLWFAFTSGGPTASDPNGTSLRQPLPFTLSATGQAHTASTTATFTAADRDGATDGFYLLANPFAATFDLSGISTDAGVLQRVYQIWDPGLRSYETRTALPGDASTNAADDVSVWQGFFAEVRTAPDGGGTPYNPDGAPLVFTYDAASVTATTPPILGTPGRGVDEQALAARASATADGDAGILRLSLHGTAPGGQRFHDHAASLFTMRGTDLGWDVYDASKLDPLAGPAYTLALLGDRAGAEVAHAQRSIPSVLAGPVEIALRLTVPAATRLSLLWRHAASLPASWTVDLVDRASGRAIDVRADTSYAFEASTADTARLFLRIRPGTATAADAADGPSGLADDAIEVSRPYPSPARSLVRVGVRVGASQRVVAELYDVLGRRVSVLFDGEMAARQRRELVVDAGALPAGLYVVRVRGPHGFESRLLTVAR